MNAVLNFPVICFHRQFALLVKDWENLTTTTKTALKRGNFDNLLIVDSTGQAVRVKGARRLHGIGPFGGYNIFLNQRIKVTLEYDGAPFQMSLEEVKERIFRSFEEWEGWSASSNFEELQEQIQRSTSIKEIFEIICST